MKSAHFHAICVFCSIKIAVLGRVWGQLQLEPATCGFWEAAEQFLFVVTDNLVRREVVVLWMKSLLEGCSRASTKDFPLRVSV